ncbi:hypothetical protein RFI_07993 [Reticulomyxa filosa]|uniref:Uncharacterized protein n=1 Tax=Reticulomyxa filosa TaxID=46433 RepID=X6NT47_RETFI|nr:hypothetical protein RFI_07993 [Reticulomyxa filosa]|eukprot:ETO29133.1 hypothetical protein RFI_07993 [Reticulomyxa filosa]
MTEMEESLEKHTEELGKRVQNSIIKFRDIENTGDLINAGVSPNLFIANFQPVVLFTFFFLVPFSNKQEEKEAVATTQEAKKGEWIGFNYEQKRTEIKGLIEQLLDCANEVDESNKDLQVPFFAQTKPNCKSFHLI